MDLHELFRFVENENERAGEKDRVAVLCHPADIKEAEEVARELLSVYDCRIYLSQCKENWLNESEAEELKTARLSLRPEEEKRDVAGGLYRFQALPRGRRRGPSISDPRADGENKNDAGSDRTRTGGNV